MNWEITQIKTYQDSLGDVVVNASFKVSDGVSYIESDVDLNEINKDNFIPLQDITEDRMIQWVKEALNRGGAEEAGVTQVDIYEKMVEAKTQSKSVNVKPLPWL